VAKTLPKTAHPRGCDRPVKTGNVSAARNTTVAGSEVIEIPIRKAGRASQLAKKGAWKGLNFLGDRPTYDALQVKQYQPARQGPGSEDPKTRLQRNAQAASTARAKRR